LARHKHPAGRFTQADVQTFRLSGRYDAVIRLFSSIGYRRTADRVTNALRGFRPPPVIFGWTGRRRPQQVVAQQRNPFARPPSTN
jgi:hypothetical protein